MVFSNKFLPGGAALVIAFLLYRPRLGSHLNVTPEAEREIEKAKRRCFRWLAARWACGAAWDCWAR